MQTVTSDFKTAIKDELVYSSGYLQVHDIDNSTDTLADGNTISNINIFGTAFNNGKVVGNLVQCSLETNILGDKTAEINANTEKEITPYIGVLAGNYIYPESDLYPNTDLYPLAGNIFLMYQRFMVVSADFDETSNLTRIVATDYMAKLNKEFYDDNTYPMTLKAYAESVLTYCGLTLENSTFLNDAFSVTSQPFVDGITCREIMQRVAEMALSFGFINRDNKFQLVSAFRSLTTEDDDIPKSSYWTLKKKENNFGSNGINTLVLRLSQVEGENNTVENATNVAIDGAIELVIEDNDFINTEAKRLSVINDMFDVIDGYKYQGYEIDYRGYPYLDFGDIVAITDKDDNVFNSPIYELSIDYNGGLKGKLHGHTLSKTQTAYKNFPTVKQAIRRTELLVDKVAGEITAYVDNAFNIIVGSTVPINTHNYVLNSNFASNFANWTNNGTGTGTRTIETIDGKKYFRLATTNTTNSFYGIRQDIYPYQHGLEITYSITCRRNSGDGRLRFRVESLGDGNQNPIIDNYIDPTSEFVRYEFTFTSSSVAEKEYYRLFLVMETNKVAQIDMSDVQLEVGSSATDYILNPAEIPSTKYIFTREGASFYADAFKLYNAINELKVFFDLVKDALNLGINVNMPVYMPTGITELVQIMSGGTKGLQFGEPDSVSGWYKAYITAVNMKTISGLSEDEIRLRIRSGENLELFGDDLLSLNSDGVISVNRGIRFPSDQVASTNVNTLDDYEEGTWTPTIFGITSAGTATYSLQDGKYTKIGNVVHFNARLAWTGHTGTGAMALSLPFKNGSTFAACSIAFSNITFANIPAGLIGINENRVVFYTFANGAPLQTLAMDSAGTIWISGSYMV